jgi:hypothetical protein
MTMRSARFALLLSVLFFNIPGWAQQAAPPNVQGAVLLQQAFGALAGTMSITDVTLSGTARRIAGSDDESGTVVLKALATGQSRMDFAFPSGQRGEIRSISSDGSPVGTWTGPDGKSHAVSEHNLMTSSTWFQPALVVGGLISLNQIVSYVGQETKNGASVLHLTTSQQFPDTPVRIATLLQHLSQVDVFLDSATLLPTTLAFNVHPDNDAGLDIPAEVRFSDYRAINGVQAPFHVQEYLNNGLVLDLQMQSVTLNSGMTTAAFAIQ